MTAKIVYSLLLLLVMVCGSFTRHRHHVPGFSDDRNTLRFVVMGDWGGLPLFPYRTYIEKAVASQMGHVADILDTDFVLALGDNFYFEGVKDKHDARFNETFENVFQAKALQRPWYLVAGNHDHNGNVSAQIEYTDLSHRWNFPNYYYLLNFRVAGSNATLSILMIDTVLLCGNTFTATDQPGGVLNEATANKQWMWIENNLKNNKASYVIVAGHFPVWSVAEHGPTKCLLEGLLPLLYKYRVTAYMSGHDHNLQHLQYSSSDHTVEYFVSGSANFIDPSLAHKDSVPADSLKFHWADPMGLGGFGVTEVSAQNMTFTFVTADGKVMHQQIMYPRKL